LGVLQHLSVIQTDKCFYLIYTISTSQKRKGNNLSQQTPESQCNEMIAQYALTISRAMLVQATAQALSNAAQNGTFVQQQQNIVRNTNTALSTAMLHTIGATYAKK
jgi:hypothetical protein|tara:strand:- start:975 stop:1292 length:318 start_codon:yes stop_codon:yes gene_type:complete